MIHSVETVCIPELKVNIPVSRDEKTLEWEGLKNGDRAEDQVGAAC